MDIQFVNINHGVPQLIPGKIHVEIGHRKGVGKNSREWLGISIKIWMGHAHI